MVEQTFDIEDALDEVREFLPALIESCEFVADLLYDRVTEDTWNSFGSVIQGIDDIYRTLGAIVKQLEHAATNSAAYTYITDFLRLLESNFAEMNRYSDSEDYIQASDILRYELVSLFQGLSTFLGNSTAEKKMMFNRNADYLKEKYPAVYHRVMEIDSVNESCQITYSKNGTPNLRIQIEDDFFIHFYSQYDPWYEASKWIDHTAAVVEGKTNVLFYGLGFGYHLERFTAEFPNIQCYVYEPDTRIFVAAMHVVDLKALFERSNIRHLSVGEGRETIEQFFYRFLRFVKGETGIVSLAVYDRIRVDEKRNFSEFAKNAVLNYAFSQSLLQNAGLQWTRNILYNMAINLDSPSMLGWKDKFHGATAVIVGAGPSLETDIEYLKSMKEHALIIAAGTSVQALYHFGIKPHLIVSIDGGEPNYKAFSHLNTDDVPFLYTPQLEHRIIEEKKDNIIHAFFANDIITQVLMGVTHEDPVFASTHSVTGTAIQAAIYLGCKTVVFTGQDLSYPNNQVYAPGAKHFDEDYPDYIKSIARLTVENVAGGLNRTTDGMLLTLKDIEELLEKHPSVKFINCSKRGAKINNTVFQPMEAVLESVRHQHVEENELRIAASRFLKRHDKSRIDTAAARVTELLDLLAKMDIKLAYIQRQLQRLSGKSRGNSLKTLNIMVNIEEEWETVVKSILFHTLFMLGLKSEINKFDRDVSELANEKDIKRKAEMFCEILGPMVNAMRERVPTFIEIVEESERRIARRLSKTPLEVEL